MTSYIKKFNPYDLPESTLRAIATGRERVLEDILAVIARNAEGGAVQHLQVVAPRGYGKSFLMRLVQSALSARAEEGLPVELALLPEEQHNVDAPHRLLNEIQRVLEGRPAGSLLGSAFADNDMAWPSAVAALDASIAAILPDGCGVVVAIVENFDQLMADVFRRAQDQSRLRALLARQGGRLMLLATATRRADAAYEQRMFHATRLIELEPWEEATCLSFFERLRGQRQAGPLPAKTRAKAQAIAQFIGGSPRMATALAGVLDSNDSLQAAEVLDALVDELTPYYKHRIETLSRRARTLLDALLRMGEPRTQSEIAARLGTVQARIAEPFHELRARGEVVGVKAQRSAEMLYRVSDRLMAHYYRKRHLSPGGEASLLEGITELLAEFFTPEEKQEEAKRLRALGREADAVVLERLLTADLERAGGGQPSLGPDPLWKRMLASVAVDQIAEALGLLREALLALAERTDDAAEPRPGTFVHWYAALKRGDDASFMLWQHIFATELEARTKDSEFPLIMLWFGEIAVAALRSGHFGTVWSTAAALRVDAHHMCLLWAQHKLAATVAKASQTQGRAAAYGLVAHAVEVLAQDAVARATRDGSVGPDPIDFLRGIVLWLVEQIADPALLRDIAALLEVRLPSETAAARALLDAAARRAENPNDAAALERVDPDVATALERLRGTAPKPAPKTPFRQGKRSAPRRKK